MFMSSSALRQLASRTTNKSWFHSSPIAWDKLNVKGLAEKVNLKGQNVLVRVDLNVPLAKVRECNV
jgi:hypothetical protein